MVILRSLPDIFFIINRKYELLFANGTVEKLLKYSQQELQGNDVRDIFDNVGMQLPKEKFETALTKGKTEDFYNEYHGTHYNFKLYPVELGLIVSGRDVTESRKAAIDRKNYNNALEKSMKEIADYKFALDESSIVSVTDEKGIINHVNDNFCKITKYSREELIGHHHQMIGSSFHSDEYIQDLRDTISAGRIWKGELKNKAKDGSLYWVDTTIVPFINEEGKPYQHMAIWSNITQRKLLEEQRALFQSIVSSSDDAIISKNLNSVITSWNYGAEKLFGYTADEAIGKSIIMLIPEERLNEETIILDNIKRGLSFEHYETERLRKDGKLVTISLTVSPVKNSEGVIIGASKIARDITARKQVEEEVRILNEQLEERVKQRTAELQDLNNELESFSYSISHDLRAPLRAINGFSFRTQKTLEGRLTEDEKNDFGKIISNTKRMGELIDDLLEFSRLGRTEIVKYKFSMADVVEQILKENYKGKTDVNVSVNITHNVPCDLNMLKQVWVNLIDNAVKYSSKNEHPRIEIGSSEENGIVTYYIQDNGVGFDMKYANKLFGVFQRLHSAEEFEGVGVGLAIVKKIIVKHGGTVGAESNKNEGARFFFTLPK